MKLLVVCSGNICRSPMAAEYLRHRAAHAGLAHLVVESAGTLGIVGRSASVEAVKVMAEIGVDLEGHRSRGITETDLRTSDLIVVMEHDHLERIAATYPEFDTPRRLLRAFEKGPQPSPSPRDLADPIGEPIRFYREQRGLIVRCVDHLLLYLKHLDSGAVPTDS